MLYETIGTGAVKRDAGKTQVTGLVVGNPEAVDEAHRKCLQFFGPVRMRSPMNMRMQMVRAHVIMSGEPSVMVVMCVVVVVVLVVMTMFMIVVNMVIVAVMMSRHRLTPRPDRPEWSPACR